MFVSFQPPQRCPKCNGAGRPTSSPVHTRIIHFVGGEKRTIQKVVSVWENQFVHIMTANGIEWIINRDKVLCVEVIGNKEARHE